MDSIVKAKADSFSNRIINMYKHLRNVHREYVMSVQVLRSGTSIGANIAESRYAQSDLDFINKLSIALKEANETCYWLNCLEKGNFIERRGFLSMQKDATELIKILTSAIKTKKKNMAMTANKQQ